MASSSGAAYGVDKLVGGGTNGKDPTFEPIIVIVSVSVFEIGDISLI